MDFGTPLSSIPNTSWMNVSSPVSSAADAGSLGFSGAATGTGAGSMALGPWMAASAGIQGLAGIAGGLMGQQSAREAREEANKWGARNMGFDMFMQDRDMARQMQALREGYGFMQSPTFQQRSNQDFRQNFMLSGKFDPYLTAMASRLS